MLTAQTYSYDKNGDFKETNFTKGVNGQDYVFFWAGPYSNWHFQPFTHDGTQYNCSEQYMMVMKARVFDDAESEKLIMESGSPGEQKAYGRKVKGFDSALWSEHCVDIMVPALVSKFTSTPRLQQLILSSGDATMVEASPYDQIWGVGLGVNDRRILDEAQWRGKNLLGICLMKARNEIKHANHI